MSEQIWDHVVDTLEKISETNSDIAQELKSIGEESRSEFEFTVKFKNMMEQKFPHANKSYGLDKVQLKAMKKLSSIERPKFKNFIQSRIQTMELLADFKNGNLNVEMKLADLLIAGPQNEFEASLLQTAQMMLEPAEFSELIFSKSTIEKVAKKIDESIVKKLMFQAFVIYHMQIMQSSLAQAPEFKTITSALAKITSMDAQSSFLSLFLSDQKDVTTTPSIPTTGRSHELSR